MIYNTFLNSFHSFIDPPNEEELLDAIDNAQLHENQEFGWTDGCNVMVERLSLEDINQSILGPSIAQYFDHVGQLSTLPTRPFSIKVNDVWRTTYKRGGFQELHDHLPSDVSGVIFLDDDEDDFAQFYFHHRHHSDWSEEWRSLFFPESRVYLRGEKGQVLFFPSHMMHGVTPHNSDKLRKTVAFNIKLQQ